MVELRIHAVERGARPADLVEHAAARRGARLRLRRRSPTTTTRGSSAQGHSPFVWSVLGAIAAATERIEVGVGVTCPIMRIHPAVLAQADGDDLAAVRGPVLLRRRHRRGAERAHPRAPVAAARGPPGDARGGRRGHPRAVDRRDRRPPRARYYEVENARALRPAASRAPPIIVSAFGPEGRRRSPAGSATATGAHSPQAELLDAFENAGGTGPRYAQLNLCWAEDEADARARPCTRSGRTPASPGSSRRTCPRGRTSSRPPSWSPRTTATKSVPCGPDVEPVRRAVRQYLDAGYDHLYFHQIGPDQDGFFRFWESELQPALRDLAPSEARRAG